MSLNFILTPNVVNRSEGGKSMPAEVMDHLRD